MSPEPAELQILKQALGDERGQYVFAANLMANTLAQLSQQVREQADRLAQLSPPPAAPDGAEPPHGGPNPWTGANGAVREPEALAVEAPS